MTDNTTEIKTADDAVSTEKISTEKISTEKISSKALNSEASKSETVNSGKKQLLIFVAIAFGVTYLMGIFMYIGFRKGVDLSEFALAQMLYPAAGVMLGTLLTKKKETKVPIATFIATIVLTVLSMILSLLAVFAPIPDLDLMGQSIGIYYLIGQYLLIPVAILVYILIWAEGKEKRINAGLERRNIGMSVLMVLLFIVLYFGRLFLGFGIEQLVDGTGFEQMKEWLATMATPMTFVNILVLPVNFFLTFIMFLGEEYGWRYYLQPVLQKKFGLRGGVLLLGLVWGLWHLPIDFMYYTRTTGAQMLINQIIVCTGYAIFFGYAYMKTKNIWVPVIIHYLNNNLVPIIEANYSADVLENQAISWSDIPVSFVLMLIYMVFIFAKEYRTEKKMTEEN